MEGSIKAGDTLAACRKTLQNSDFRNFAFNDINNLQNLPKANLVFLRLDWSLYRLCGKQRLAKMVGKGRTMEIILSIELIDAMKA
jgi:hypothetical protein